MIPQSSTAPSNTAQAVEAALDDEHKGATVANGVSSSSVDMHARRPSPLNLGTSKLPSCSCGESLCGYDCHFLQQEQQELEAAAARATCQHTRNGSTNSEEQNYEQSEADEAVANLEHRFRRHFSSATGFDNACVDNILAAPSSDVGNLPPSARASLRRTKSCGVHSAQFHQAQLRLRPNSYRMRINYHDEALRERCEQNTQALLQRAVSDDSDATSTATILARKALRYRRVLERLEGIDVMDPSLDVSRCLGVCWQRVGSTEQ